MRKKKEMEEEERVRKLKEEEMENEFRIARESMLRGNGSFTNDDLVSVGSSSSSGQLPLLGTNAGGSSSSSNVIVVENSSPKPEEKPKPSSSNSKEEHPQVPLLIESFSLIGKSGTLTKLIEMPPADNSKRKPTDCLNGLRVLSMFWILLGHTFLMPMGITGGYLNSEDLIRSNLISPDKRTTYEDSLWLMIVLQAELGVDTFFYMSGFLLSFLTVQEVDKKEKQKKNQNGKGGWNSTQNFFLAVLFRYIRLTPSLALVMLLFYKIMPLLATGIFAGPFSYAYQKSITDRCDISWWSELLYTMNFFPFDSNKVCMGWSWYLGCDMIFFVICMLIIPVYIKKSKKLAIGIIVFVLMIPSLAITTYLIQTYDLSPYLDVAFGSAISRLRQIAGL